MIMILNGITYAGIGVGFVLDRFGKRCAFPMIVALLCQLIVLAFVIGIGVMLEKDTETAAIVMDFVSSPSDFMDLVKNTAPSEFIAFVKAAAIS